MSLYLHNTKRGLIWEADTIIGKVDKGAIFTIDERKSKLRLAFPLFSKSSKQVTEAEKKLLTPIKKTIKLSLMKMRMIYYISIFLKAWR